MLNIQKYVLTYQRVYDTTCRSVYNIIIITKGLPVHVEKSQQHDIKKIDELECFDESNERWGQNDN